MDPSNTEPKRRRGIKASRTKLMQALLNAGLKAQADVAERIADIEQLDSAPRGLVNKVFRGETVDAQSIERVARALNVEGWQVYLTADEVESQSTSVTTTNTSTNEVTGSESITRDLGPLANADEDTETIDTTVKDPTVTQSQSSTPEKPRWVGWRVLGACAALTVVALLVWRFSIRSDALLASSIQSSSNPIQSIVVAPFTGERASDIATALEIALAKQFTLLPGTAVALSESNDPQSILSSRNADAVITGEAHQMGRYIAIRLFVHTRGQMRHLWTEIVPQAATPAYLQQRLAIAANTMGFNRAGLESVALQTTDAEQRVLAGRLHLDKPRTEKNSLRALAEFHSALRAAPDSAVAHSGLCEALINESIRTGNVRRLDEARDSCARALSLDALLVDSVRAQANLDRKQGRIDEALKGTARALEMNANDVDSLLIAAEANLAQQNNTNATERYAQAIELLNRAQKIDPTFWKLPTTLARVHFAQGDVNAAIAAQTIGTDLDRNSHTLNNLGSFQFCAAQFSKARESFTAARLLQPDEYIGDAQIAVMDYQLRQFDKAAEGFAQAARLHEANGDPDVFQLWGNLGDSLRMAGKPVESAAAYEKAIALVEQAVTKDNTVRARAFRTSYYTSMMLINKDFLNDALRQSLLRELSDLETSTSPDALLEVASSYWRLGQRDKATTLRSRLAPGCPGYNINPEFDLAKTNR